MTTTTLSITDAATTIAVHDRLSTITGLGANERNAALTLAVAHATGTPLTMSMLSSRIHLSRAALTSLVDRFETEGLAERKLNAGDRRKIDVCATPKLLRLLEEAFAPAVVAAA